MLVLPVVSQAVTVERVVHEGGSVGGFSVLSLDGLDVSPGGAFVLRVRDGTAGTATTQERYVGSTTRGGPAAILLGETDIAVGSDTYRRNELFGSPLINDASQVLHNGQSIRLPFTSDVDTIWLNDTLLAIDGDALPGDPAALYTSFATVGLTATGTPYFRASYGSSSQALLAGPSAVIAKSGDLIPTTTDTYSASSPFTSPRTSRDGTRLITKALGTTAGAANEYVISGSTVLARENDVIGVANGGLSTTERWNNIAAVAINNAGDWMMTGFTDGGSTVETFVARNGQVVAREGGAVPLAGGGTVILEATGQPGFGLNNQGDWVANFENAIIFNGLAIVQPDVTAIAASTDILQDIQSVVGLSDRYGPGGNLVDIYFMGRQYGSVGGPTNSNDGIYRFTYAIPEPATGICLGLALVLLRRRR